MRSLIQVITSILNSEEYIPELPLENIILFEHCGHSIEGTSNEKLFLKVARLQTLIFKEKERSEVPEMDEIKEMAKQSKKDVQLIMADFLAIQEDANLNSLMLQRLIVQIVRNDHPKECERFDVNYVADISNQIFFCDIPQQYFLD